MYKLAKVALRVIALSGFLHLSCGRDPGASVYQTPEITNVYADAEAHRVLFRCDVLRAGNIRECGIYFGETEDNLQKIPGSFTDKNRFTATRKGLESGREYYFKAFVNNGVSEYSTEIKRFTTVAGDPGINIPDPSFRNYILSHFDANEDGVLNQKEAFDIRKIEICPDSVSTIEGIEHFPELEELICIGTVSEDDGTFNGRLTSVDVSRNSRLWRLDLGYNRLKEIDVSKNEQLELLIVSYNLITELDISHNKRLRHVGCSPSGPMRISAIDFSRCPELDFVGLSGFGGEVVDFSANSEVQQIYLSWSNLEKVILPDAPILFLLDLAEAHLQGTLDLGGCPALRILRLQHNPDLEKVILRTGLKLEEFQVDPHVIIEYV
ncbi:MAG: hypothetical protein GX125_04605 [Bacteroidales bacterium]|jgi:hypothetical protein|nr:hypothetical protein [Bacteroidales bacterium]